MNDIEREFQLIETQQNIVNAIKDLVVVQGMMVKANGLTKLSSNETIKLEEIILRNI